MAVSDAVRALGMLADQRRSNALRSDQLNARLQSAVSSALGQMAQNDYRDEAQQQSQDFQRQMTLEQEQRRERAAAVAQGQDRLRQIESNRALSDVLGENIPAALDPVAARGYAGDVMRQRGFDARNAAEIEQERIRAQQDAAEAAAKDQAAQAAAMQQRDDRFALASALNLPLVEYGVNGTPLPPPEALKAMASAQEAQAEQARMQRETDPNFKAGELLFKLKQGLPTGLPEDVSPHEYLMEIAPRDANGNMHPKWVEKQVDALMKLSAPKEESGGTSFQPGERERDQELDRMVRETRAAAEKFSALQGIEDESVLRTEAIRAGISPMLVMDPEALRQKITELEAKANAAMLKRNQFYKDRGEMPPYLEIE